jgi:hypothetical protein
MKNAIKTLVICYLVAFIFSCTKKESDNVTPNIQKESIVGKWKDAGTKGVIKIEYQGQKVSKPIDEVASNEITEFKADGTILNLSAPGEGTQFSKYSTKGDQLTLVGTEAGKTFEFVFTYKITGGQLVLSMDKALFVRNISAISKAGFDTGFEDIMEFIDLITEIQYDHFMSRQ